MNQTIEYFTSRPLPTVGTTTGVSATGAAVSFAEHTLPLVQWAGAAVAVISGFVGIAVGLWHLKEIWKKEHLK